MAATFQFAPPAKQLDFPKDSSKQSALNAQWNLNLTGFTEQGIVGDPWNSTNNANASNYINPVENPPPASSTVTSITWAAFPGRIGYYFPKLTAAQQLQLADTGYLPDGSSFPNITTDPCSGAAINLPYGPYGPRGWQDEYCEWSVTRNSSGNIVRVDFTCENPEYFNSLWLIDPQRVVELYQTALNNAAIPLTDLYLYDKAGNAIIDPSTGRPAYNPLNKWNAGTTSTAGVGGAMHLTSTPNTLQTEIGLASASTTQRNISNPNDPNALICCAQYGQPHRNSDPHIGYSSNKLVALGNAVTLTNPPGLYIQTPDFSSYVTPDGSDPSSYWQIVRGSSTLKGDDGNALPGNFILHAVYEVPTSKGFTVSDIKINSNPIQWGGQIAQTFLMQIVATAVKATTPSAMSCVGSTPPSQTLAQPLQLFHAAVFKGMAAVTVPNPVNQPMNLLSNSTLIAPLVAQGANNVPMVLVAATIQPGPQQQMPQVAFENCLLTASVTDMTTVTYAIPGNSYPSTSTVLYLNVSVADATPPGLHAVMITNYGQTPGEAMPALINVVPAGSIQK